VDGNGAISSDVGAYCSIDLNAAGQPAISYYDNSNGDLKASVSYTLPPMTGNLFFLPIIRR
jgi:hypothetical protein